MFHNITHIFIVANGSVVTGPGDVIVNMEPGADGVNPSAVPPVAIQQPAMPPDGPPGKVVKLYVTSMYPW